jgi:predicted metal-dependent enzyme (double-stranded beta helix superfamily)
VSLTPGALAQFVAGLAAARERWEHLVRHADDARAYDQIWDDADVNARVICWSEDQDTGFHDHDLSAASIAVISGAVREDRLRLGSGPSSRVIHAPATFSVPPVAIHRVMHAGGAPAVTIHAYSPPLTRTGVYRTGAAGELQRESLTLEEELRAEPSLR